MMMRRAKFHHGHPSQCCHPKFKTFKLGHHSHALSSVNHSVSESLLRLLLVPAVHSPPNCRALLICLPTVHHYFWLQCRMELLHHRLLMPHPTVGPIPPMEHKVTVTTVTSDHPVPYCPITSTHSPSVYSMYSPFLFLSICLVAPLIGECVVRSVSLYDYLICFLSCFQSLYVPVSFHY